MICAMKSAGVIAKSILNLVYPLRCALCGKDLDPLGRSGVCAACLHTVRRNPGPHCRKCGRSVQDGPGLCAECRTHHFHFEMARSACLYEGALKELIRLFKYKGRISLGRTLSSFLIDLACEDKDLLGGIDTVTYVPVQEALLRKREFNHSKVLAARLGDESGIPLADMLQKTRSTKRQNELSRAGRLTNLRGAFRAARRSAVSGKNILIVDDVMTTGATLDECAKTLLDAGAGKVRCLTLARGL
ncbi:MAG: ComF family protein [Candidatus Omnitrophota bacterium]